MEKNVVFKRFQSIPILFLYFGVLLMLALPQGANTTFYFGSPYHLNMTVFDLQKVFKTADVGYYTVGALDLYKYGAFQLDNFWILNCYPAGFPALQAMLLHLFGLYSPLILSLCLFTDFVWATVLYNFYQVLKLRLPLKVAFLIPLIAGFSILFREYMLRNGIIMTESLSIACFMLSMLLAIRASILPLPSQHETADYHPFLYSVLAGVFLAAGAYLRAQIEMVGGILTLLAGLSVILQGLFSKQYAWTGLRFLVKPFGKNRFTHFFNFKTRFGPLNLFLLTMLVFQGFTFPYRLINYVRTDSLEWLHADYQWEYHWKYDREISAKFVVNGGATVACQVNPKRCLKIHQTLQKKGPAAFTDQYFKQKSILTFLSNPFKWLYLKTMHLSQYWFDTAYMDIAHASTIQLLCNLENGIYALLLVLSVPAAVTWVVYYFRRKPLVNLIPFLYTSGLYMTQFACYVFLHFESRYFYPIKILLLFGALGFLGIAIAEAIQSKKTILSGNFSPPTSPFQSERIISGCNQ